MIPKSRFDEVNEERRKLADRITQIDAERKADTEKRLIEQSEFKKLAESRGEELTKAQEIASKVDAYEKTLADVLAAQVASLPEDKRDLVPDELTTQQKLAWLAKNAAILKAPASFDIGAGRQGGGEPPRKVSPLSAEEIEVAHRFGMTEAEYLKNK
jgi:phage I-like protein